jgi:hypothetical protein
MGKGARGLVGASATVGHFAGLVVTGRNRSPEAQATPTVVADGSIPLSHAPGASHPSL